MSEHGRDGGARTVEVPDVCPRCGEYVRTIDGRFGTFYRCSSCEWKCDPVREGRRPPVHRSPDEVVESRGEWWKRLGYEVCARCGEELAIDTSDWQDARFSVVGKDAEGKPTIVYQSVPRLGPVCMRAELDKRSGPVLQAPPRRAP